MKRISIWLLLVSVLLGCKDTDALTRARTDAAAAYVNRCRDVTDEALQREYDRLSGEADALEYRSADPAILPLLSRERALLAQYDALPYTLTLEMFGRTWTGDAVLGDPTLTAEEFDALYEAYLARFGDAAGTIYLDLLAVRKEIAKTLGFGSFAAYAYRGTGRLPEDAAAFCERAAAAFAPLLEEWRGDFFLAAGRLYGTSFGIEPTMSRVRAAIVSLLPEFSEPWDHLVSRKLYDIGTGPMRMPGSFTAYFAADGEPFLFVDWTGAFDMPPEIAHAFGRYASLYRNGCTNLPDLAEIDAQGLELLTVLRYDMIYGDICDEAETAELYYAVYALLDGCAEDAFLRFVCEKDDLSVEDLNAAYGRICETYGLTALGEEPRSWTRDPRIFREPFCGVGSAAGMTAALGLFLEAQRDRNAALDAYRAVLARSGETAADTLAIAGISDPFAEGTAERTANGLRAYRNEKRMRKDREI